MILKTIFKERSLLIGLLLFLIQTGVSGQEQIITDSPGQDRHPWWSPDGEQIVFESDRDGDWELFVINANGRQERQLTKNGFHDRNPSWHPNGDRILFESNRSGKFQLYTIRLSDLSVEKIGLESFKLEPTTARYSPDGSQIVFCANQNLEALQLNLFLTAATGGAVTQITFDQTRSFYPSWSPTGEQLVFFSRRDTQGQQDELYIMDMTRAQRPVKRITTYPNHDFCPHWSATGDKLVFSSSITNARPDLFMSTTDGRNIKQLTFTPTEGETQAVWSPDGKKLAYAGFRNGNYELCIMKVED